MSYSPPLGRRTLLPSILTHVLNWVHDLDVAVPGAANVAVPVDDLRPRVKHIQITLDAVDDIRFCEKLFDKWMTELDKVPRDSKKGDNRDQALGFYLGRLKEQVGSCSNTANEILQYQVRFASLMAQQIDDASKSQYNANAGPEATKLAKDISKASHFLSINVEKVTQDLGSFVSTLEKIQVKVKKKRSPTERIHVEPQEGKESESLDSVILFLRQIVPNEAQNAQKKLKRSDEAIRIMERMSVGQLAIGGSGAAAVAKEWRDVAKQYQSALEQKSCS